MSLLVLFGMLQMAVALTAVAMFAGRWARMDRTRKVLLVYLATSGAADLVGMILFRQGIPNLGFFHVVTLVQGILVLDLLACLGTSRRLARVLQVAWVLAWMVIPRRPGALDAALAPALACGIQLVVWRPWRTILDHPLPLRYQADFWALAGLIVCQTASLVGHAAGAVLLPTHVEAFRDLWTARNLFCCLGTHLLAFSFLRFFPWSGSFSSSPSAS